MNDAGAGARPREELDLEALTRGDRFSADVLVKLCDGNRAYVLEPDVFAALRILSKARSLARHWEALLAQLRSVHVDVQALKRALRGVDEVKDDDDDDDDNKRDSQVDRLLAIANSYECFRNEFEKPFVSLEARRSDGGAHLETLGVRSRKLRLSLIYEYLIDHGRAPGDAAIRVVIDTLEARALCGGVIRPVAIRHCWHDGKIYIDLGTEDRKVVEVDAADWRILDGAPADVRFLRPTGTLPLPMPERVDPKVALVKLREVTRFQTDRDAIISVGFVLHSLAGKKPFAVLLITGEPGAAKTAHVIVIGGLVDPRSVLKGTALTTKRDIYIAASTRGLTVLNNASEMSRDIADAVCTSSEGGVDARRALYTDEDESNIYAESPFVITSIFNVVAPYGDLSNRTVRVDLAPMPRGNRLSESDFQAKFDAVAPTILGGMMGALSVGLRRLPGLVVKDLPRLAEFATFASACETAFWDEGTFLKAFNEAAEANADEVLLGDPVSVFLQRFMEEQAIVAPGKKEWKGTVTDLLKELETVIRAPERAAEMAFAMAKNAVKDRDDTVGVRKMTEAASDLREAREHVHTILDAKWPKAANALSARLKLVGPQLKDAGVWIKWPTSHRDEKVLEITYRFISPHPYKSQGKRSSPSSPSSYENKINQLHGDDPSTGDDHDCPSGRPASFDPDYFPPEPDNPDLQGESASSSVADRASDHAPTADRQSTPGLHKGRKGFEI
jgi:hypothetical protein